MRKPFFMLMLIFYDLRFLNSRVFSWVALVVRTRVPQRGFVPIRSGYLLDCQFCFETGIRVVKTIRPETLQFYQIQTLQKGIGA